MPAVSQLIAKTVTRFPRFARQEIIVHPLEKGGSDRKFYRMAFNDAHSMILAKYGRQREENRHYVAIARFLAGVNRLNDRTRLELARVDHRDREVLTAVAADRAVVGIAR